MRLKSINLFVLAIVLAVTTSFATTSSSHSKLTRYYYYDNDGTDPNPAAWHQTAPSGGLGLICAEAAPDKICSADFDIEPENNPVTNDAEASTVTFGLYQ